MDYHEFGNFNYGAVALGFGFMEKWALQAAGFIQIKTGKGFPIPFQDGFSDRINGYRAIFQGPPYGDNEEDQEMIKKGFQYYKEVYSAKGNESRTAKEEMLQSIEQATKPPFPWRLI